MTNIELHKEISRLLILTEVTPSDKGSMQNILNTIYIKERSFCKSCSGEVRSAFNSIRGYFIVHKDNLVNNPTDIVKPC